MFKVKDFFLILVYFIHSMDRTYSNPVKPNIIMIMTDDMVSNNYFKGVQMFDFKVNKVFQNFKKLNMFRVGTM